MTIFGDSLLSKSTGSRPGWVVRFPLPEHPFAREDLAVENGLALLGWAKKQADTGPGTATNLDDGRTNEN